MTYLDRSSGDRSCPTDHTHEAVGVSSAGMPVSDTPTMPRLNGCETRTDSDRKTYAQIVEHRQQEAHERQKEAQAWAVKVSEQLHNERSKFLEEFDENEKRIFGVI